MRDPLQLIKQLAGLTENAHQKVRFIGFNSTGYPLSQAIADKAYREGSLVKLSMDPTGKPVAIINDPKSMGQYEAYWNDQAGSWAIDFD